MFGFFCLLDLGPRSAYIFPGTRETEQYKKGQIRFSMALTPPCTTASVVRCSGQTGRGERDSSMESGSTKSCIRHDTSSAPDSLCSMGPSMRKEALAGILGFLGTEDAESHLHLTMPHVKLQGPLTFMAVSLKVHVNGP